MFLSKIKPNRPLLLWKTYSSWLVFCICILILTNGLASLTLIRAYRFPVIDILLTYGLLIFWGVLESALLAALMVLAEVALEKVLKKRFDLPFRIILVLCLLSTWVILFLTVLRIL